MTTAAPSTLTKSLLLLSLAFPAIAFAGPPTGKEVLENQEATRKLKSFEANCSLSTFKEGEKAAPKKFEWWRTLGDDAVHYVSLVRFSEPATIRGEGILLREAVKENDVLLYLPRFKKVRRVAGQSQNSSFFGSMFSYADVAVPHAHEQTAKVLREEKCPGTPKLKCWVMETTPANNGVRDRYGYARTIQWVRQDNWVTVAGDFYDKKNVLWKKLTATDVTEVDTEAHKWLALTIRMDDVIKKKSSIVKLTNVEVNQKLASTLFTEQSLKNE